jgi:tetrahydromethanopterin S-methyltransferase subunit F
MHTAFEFDRYYLRRQVISLTGKIRLYTPDGQLVLYCQQKMFRLKEDIRAYTDESCTQELLYIQARSVIDFSAAYDVIDSGYGIKAGVLRRKGWRSVMRDEWEVLNPEEQPIGVLWEDNPRRALIRRMIAGRLLPQNYDLLIGDTRVADLHQRFNLFGYEMDLDFGMDTNHLLDRRLGIAAGILLAVVEGRQDS